MKNNLPPILSDFLTYLVTNKHFSIHTRNSYESDLIQMTEFLAGHTLSGPAEATHILKMAQLYDLERYQKHMVSLRYQLSSMCRKIAAIRSFYKWMAKVGHMQTNIAAKLISPRLVRRSPVTVTAADIVALLAVIPAATTLTIRDRAMVKLMALAGLTPIQVVNSQEADYDLTKKIIKVGTREYPICDNVADEIMSYLEYKSKFQKDPDRVRMFSNKHGGKMSERSVRRTLDKYLLAAKLDPKINPRILRHTYIQSLLQKGTPIAQVSKMIGHRNTKRLEESFGKQASEKNNIAA